MRPDPQTLATVPLFASLSPPQLEAVATLTELRHEGPGEHLVGEGAPGYSLFVILEGTAAVMGGRHLLASLGPGDFFGEVALLGENLRTATVMSTSPVRLVVMYGSDFHVFERDFPEASELMRKAMAERLRRSEEREAD
jgi:CRP/FNR family transcriptional regulator, cyclic AMP receptor protein